MSAVPAMAEAQVASPAAEPLLSVRGLTKHFPVRRGLILQRTVAQVRAVDGIDFDIHPGETLGLVGESGCGKSTTGRMLVRMIEPTTGTVRFDGQDMLKQNAAQLRQTRKKLQFIFQDPFGSLNPRMTVEDIVAEPMETMGGFDRAARVRRVRELLETVGLSAAHAQRYPHEFSGGQRQRIGIARALALRPKFVVCDEPVSALDVSIQAQVINLMKVLQREFGLAYLFVAHDLAVVRHISDRVAVMYLGKIVEIAGKRQLYAAPKHPYTQALLSAVPIPRPGARRSRIPLTGEVPSPMAPPPGCRFHPRCPLATEICRTAEPMPRDLGGGQIVACHHAV